MSNNHKDRSYYRSMTDQELIEEAKRQSNELALVLAERLDDEINKPSQYVEHYLGR